MALRSEYLVENSSHVTLAFCQDIDKETPGDDIENCAPLTTQ